MPEHGSPWEEASQISLDLQPAGLKAVYVMETRSEYEEDAIEELFSELGSRIQVRKLCVGRLLGYVVQAEKSQSYLLEELEDLLRRECEVVVSQRCFDDLIYRIITDLATDTNSSIVEVPACSVCGTTEPFPTVTINLADENGGVLRTRCCCAKCAATASSRSNKEFMLSLMGSDKPDLESFARAHLVKRRSCEQSMRFRLKH